MLPVRHPLTSFLAALAGACLLLPLAACDSKSAATPANLTVGLNAHFADHPDCLFPNPLHFPYETSDPGMTKQLDALVTEQLLTVARERELHVSRYTISDAGVRYAPRFCYGHRHVTTIDNFTPPVPANGFPETQVTYRYAMQDVPVWVKSDTMHTAFPIMALATSGSASDKATMASTMAGWQVPD